MFAIKITTMTLPMIRERMGDEKFESSNLELFVDRSIDWFLITGYVNLSGVRSTEFALVPQYIFNKTFDHDPEKVHTDWVNIVRKENKK